MDIRQAYLQHYSVCRYCKNSNTERIIPEAGMEKYAYRCSCGGFWHHPEPTEEDLERFYNFAKGNYIF